MTFIWLIVVMGFCLWSGRADSISCGQDKNWTGSVVLSDRIGFRLEYLVEHSRLLLRLRSHRVGFVGIGFSETGHMLGADVAVVTVDELSGKATVRDMFVNWDAFPVATPVPIDDVCQDWTAECSTVTKHEQVVVISRALDTKDAQDRAVNLTEPNIVIFAWGEGPSGLTYHGANRGTTYLSFANHVIDRKPGPKKFVPPADADDSVTLRLNGFILQSKRTTYVLQKFDLGSEERHIVAYEPIVSEQDKHLVHHILVHDCGYHRFVFPLYYLLPNVPKDLNTSPLGAGGCTSLIVAWAKGTRPWTAPPVTGFRTGHGFARFLILEVHLDNPELLQGRRLTSGVKLYTASKLRKHDAGSITLGDAGLMFPVIPPDRQEVHYESTCPSKCTETFAGDIEVFGSFLHMHNYGREIWTTLYKKKAKSGVVIDHRQFWNFNFQETRPTQFTLERGDRLSTHCVYDTSKSQGKNVSFGLATSEEMCMDFIFYYPKTNAGMGCGFLTGDMILCKSGVMNISNPIPDGDVRVPAPLRKGEPSGHCTSHKKTLLGGNLFLFGSPHGAVVDMVYGLIPLALMIFMLRRSWWRTEGSTPRNVSPMHSRLVKQESDSNTLLMDS